MTSVIIRIALRYIAAALVAKGVFEPSVGAQIAGDVDLQNLFEIAAGGVFAGLAEGWYWLARKFGWEK